MLRSSLLAPLAFVLVAPVMAATAPLPTRAVTIGNEN